MIKSLLAPYEVYIWAALAFLLLCGGIYEVHHLENIGVQRQQAADAKLAAAQRIHKDEVESRAQELVAASGSKLHDALVAPDPIAPIIVRVCPRAPTAGYQLPTDGGAVTGSDSGSPVVHGPVADGSATQGLDIAPGTEALLQHADAEIAYWRSYYQTCKSQGICK